MLLNRTWGEALGTRTRDLAIDLLRMELKPLGQSPVTRFRSPVDKLRIEIIYILTNFLFLCHSNTHIRACLSSNKTMDSTYLHATTGTEIQELY